MLFVQASTGSGGWPMSVWLTPERKPFFGGTYFPPDKRYGRPGFGAILQSLAQAWREDRAKIEESGAQCSSSCCSTASRTPEAGARSGRMRSTRLSMLSADRSMRAWADSARAPKFPRPSVLNFLLRYGALTGE